MTDVRITFAHDGRLFLVVSLLALAAVVYFYVSNIQRVRGRGLLVLTVLRAAGPSPSPRSTSFSTTSPKRRTTSANPWSGIYGTARCFSSCSSRWSRPSGSPAST